jgi:hypothetical protein
VTAEAQQRRAGEGDLRAVLFDDHPPLDRDAVAIGHRLAEPPLDPRLPGGVQKATSASTPCAGQPSRLVSIIVAPPRLLSQRRSYWPPSKVAA